MDSLYDKLQARLTACNAGVRDKLPKKLFCTAGFPKVYRAHAETLNDLLTGLIDERKVAITYSIPGRKPYNDVIHPYTLVVHNYALYVIAFSEHARDKRMYAVERIKKAKWSRDLGFDYPAKYDPRSASAPATTPPRCASCSRPGSRPTWKPAMAQADEDQDPPRRPARGLDAGLSWRRARSLANRLRGRREGVVTEVAARRGYEAAQGRTFWKKVPSWRALAKDVVERVGVEDIFDRHAGL
jgi:hypothetical protein